MFIMFDFYGIINVMKETDFIEAIKETLSDNTFIDNDCADLKEVGMFITQDTLVEDVHFSLKTTTPFELGQKAIAVNISDLATAICNPAYVSVGLSVPENIDVEFVKELYRGMDFACKKYNAVITGGDITRAEKVFISVCAVGRRRHSINIARGNAQVGDFIITTGFYGTSAAGLYALKNGINADEKIIKAHLTPEARLYEAYTAGKYMSRDTAIMDTSDGLADALYKIAKASNVSIEVNFDDIPVLPEVKDFAKENNLNLQELVLWGGEDFELIVCLPYFTYASMGVEEFKYLGTVCDKDGTEPTVKIITNDGNIIINEELFNKKSYNHFGG